MIGITRLQPQISQNLNHLILIQVCKHSDGNHAFTQ